MSFLCLIHVFFSFIELSLYRGFSSLSLLLLILINVIDVLPDWAVCSCICRCKCLFLCSANVCMCMYVTVWTTTRVGGLLESRSTWHSQKGCGVHREP